MSRSVNAFRGRNRPERGVVVLGAGLLFGAKPMHDSPSACAPGDAGGTLRHELVFPFVYRGLTSLNLNVLVTDIPRINACFPNTIDLQPALSRIEGQPAQP